MSDVYLTFTSQENRIAYDLYCGLLKERVVPEAMDIGRVVANHNGLQCDDPKERSCFKGILDGKLEAEEVMEFAFSNYKKYQALIERTLGRPLPWVFDAKIREKADATIDMAMKLTGGNKANELMFLYAFTAFPKESLIGLIDSLIEGNKRDPEFDPKKAKDTKELLTKNGTFKLKYEDEREEHTAIEALQRGTGQCTEQSNVLFPLLDQAEYSPYYVFVDFTREYMPSLEPYIDEETKRREKHICIGVDIGGQTYILDPMFPQLISEKVPYDHYIPLSLRQYLSIEYLNYHDPKLLEDALLLDTDNPYAHLNRALNMYGNSDISKAIDDMAKFLSLMPADSKLRSDIDDEVKKRWLSNEGSRKDAETIKQDTGMDVGLIEFSFIIACASWKNNDIKKASHVLIFLMSQLRFVTQIIPKVTVAPATVKFFNEWFDIMPEEMRSNSAISFQIKTIKANLGK